MNIILSCAGGVNGKSKLFFGFFLCML